MRAHRLRADAVLRSILLERVQIRLLILLLSFTAAILGMLAPYAQKNFVEALMRAIRGGSDAVVEPWLFKAFAFSLGAQVLLQLAMWIAMRESLITQKSLGDTAFSRLLEGPGGLIGTRPAGEAVSLFAVDVPGAAAMLDQVLVMLCSMLFPLAIAPLALHWIFGIPFWATIGALGCLMAVNLALARRQSGFFQIFKQLAAERTGLVAEWVQNIRALRILGWTEAAEARIFRLRRRETRNRKIMVTNGQVMNAIGTSSTFALNILAVILLLRLRGSDHPPTGGELLSLLWILGVFLSRPLRQMPWVFVMGLDSLSSIRRIQAALQLPVVQPEVRAPMVAAAGTGVSARKDCVLSVRGLRLEIDGRKLLRGIDLDLGAGEMVAVVGEVGSGKSLLLQSLIGATGASFDRYALNGRDTAGPRDPGVRSQLAFVPQEGFTISATLRENVRFEYLREAGGKGSSAAAIADEAVLESLRLAQFDLRVERVSDGLSTEIGERGVNLSGGQRQRIGLARAHFAARPVVLLDDSLSAVDVDTEKRLIQALLLGAWRGRARLLVTHRMSVLPACDRVIFLEDGAILDQGTFDELLDRSAPFRDFVRRETQKAEAGRA